MSLTLVLEFPGLGMISPPVTDGAVEFRLDRYPRWHLTASMRPDPDAVHLWQSPYGTRAHVLRPDGSMLMSGPVLSSRIARPDGRWEMQAADDTLPLSLYRTSNRPGQFLPGTTMTMGAFIDALAALAGVSLSVTGSGGTVDVRELDIAGADAWGLVEEQLIASNLDVWPQGDGSLMIGPTAVMKAQPDHFLTVGDAGTITAYEVAMERIYNRVVITHEASKEGQSETRYIDGTWTDTTSSAGVGIGVYPYTRTVRVGADWWDDPAGHQAQADANAAAAAQTVRGIARAGAVEIVPRYDIHPGQTVAVTFMSGVTDRFLVTGAMWPLGPGAVRLDIRNSDPDWPQSTFFKSDHRRHSWAA